MKKAVKKKTREQKKPSQRARFRLLPLTVTMLSLLLLVRVNELYIDSRELRTLYAARDAVAAEKKEEVKDAAKEGEKAAADAVMKDGEKPSEPAATMADDKKMEPAKEGEAKAEDGHGGGHGGGEAKPVEEPKTFGAGKTTIKEIEAIKLREATPRYTQTELDLLQNLAKRRDEIDAREKELDIKSKVLEATEKRITDKVSEIKTLQTQLEKTLAQYNEKEAAQISSLVKIYENMKPGDAANIFNEMDLPILLEVIDKMSERKVAPVLAAMSPKKARDVTQELAEMRRSTAKVAGTTKP